MPPKRYIPLLLISLTLLVFGRSIKFDFVGFDDGLHVVTNPLLHPITQQHLKQFWTEPYKGVYMPVTYMTWAAVAEVGRTATPDAQGVDLNPYLFHLLNVALHVASVLLAWRILTRVTPNVWAAAAGAAIFAVHPLQVESVAWVSSGKDALGGMLSLAAILLYLRFAQRQSWADYAAGSFVFALALLSKASASMVPVMIALLLIIVPVVNRKRSILWLWPWCLLVLPLTWITRHAQSDATLLTWSPLWARPLEALDAVAFYIGKLFWPFKLAVDYGRTPRWMIDHPHQWLLWPLPVVACIAAIVWRRWRFGWVGLTIFAVALLPVLGLVPFEFQGFSTVADRYMYPPMLGVAVTVAGIATHLRLRRGGAWFIAIILTLATVAFVQVGVWASSATLFQHAVDVQPRSGFGWQGLAAVRGQNGDWPGALDAWQRALAIRPDDLQAMTGLAGAYRQLGDIPNYRRALNAMSYEAARRVLLKDPNSEIARRRMQQARPTTFPQAGL